MFQDLPIEMICEVMGYVRVHTALEVMEGFPQSTKFRVLRFVFLEKNTISVMYYLGWGEQLFTFMDMLTPRELRLGGNYPLARACCHRDTRILKYLIGRGLGEEDIISGDYRAVWAASCNENPEHLRVLLELVSQELRENAHTLQRVLASTIVSDQLKNAEILIGAGVRTEGLEILLGSYKPNYSKEREEFLLAHIIS